MNDADILSLVRKLEQCQLGPGDFHHRDHLAVSVVYLYAANYAAAMARMRDTLHRFLAHHRLKGYHETITRFWMEQVDQRLNRSLCLAESVERVQRELREKNLIYQFYSKDVLEGSQAKEAWIAPDLVPARETATEADSSLRLEGQS